MTLYAFICTRTTEFSSVTNDLVSYLSRVGVNVKLLVNQDSIFEGYKKAVEKIQPDPSDIIILCHDDIKINASPSDFLTILSILKNDKYGFIGPAGTTRLNSNGVWWDSENWQKGYHKGEIYHVNPNNSIYKTHYGPFGQVVVLDGVFLACRAELLNKIPIDKPSHFVGNWDFYDIYYTYEAHKLNYENHTVPINMIHMSRGELVGRDSWHENRKAFIEDNRKEFPLTC